MDTRTSGPGTASSRAYFEQQREALIGDIAEVRSFPPTNFALTSFLY